MAKTEHTAEAAASHIEEIQAEAKKAYSLRDRLAGIKQATKIVVVYDDVAPAEQWADIDRQRTNLEALLGAQDLDADQRASMQESLDALTEAAAEARANMLEHALSVHLRAVPQVVLTKAGRETTKRFGDASKQIPDDQLDNAEEFRSRYILGRVIQKVTAADGELEFDRDSIAQELEEALPVPQWRRLSEAYAELVYTDAIGAAATDDPGF